MIQDLHQLLKQVKLINSLIYFHGRIPGHIFDQVSLDSSCEAHFVQYAERIDYLEEVLVHLLS